MTAADNELNIWIRQYMIKVLQLPAGINSEVTNAEEDMVGPRGGAGTGNRPS